MPVQGRIGTADSYCIHIMRSVLGADFTYFRHIDLNILSYLETGRGRSIIQVSVSIDDDDEDESHGGVVAKGEGPREGGRWVRLRCEQTLYRQELGYQML